MLRILISASLLAVALFSLEASRAEVTDSDANGFSIRHERIVAASPNATYQSLVQDVGRWWNPDHTVSGIAESLYIEARPQGCFCEALGADAGLVHMTVSFVNPGVMLRMTGGLGPLGLMGVAGNMTFEFDAIEGGTRITLRYIVGGYQPGGLQSLASPVDGVLLEALERLGSFVERGAPLAEE